MEATLNDTIDNKELIVMSLPIEVAVYVPSTKNANEPISKEELDSRVDEVRKYLGTMFGGFSSEPITGGYVSSKNELIKEDVVRVVAFSTKETYETNKDNLIEQVSKWAKEWSQESIGLEFENSLYYINQTQKLKYGGKIGETIPEPKFKGKKMKLKGYGEVKVTDVGWLTPPLVAESGYMYDFKVNPKSKRNDLSLYEYEVDMMLEGVDTGIDYEASYQNYLDAGVNKTGNPPLSKNKFIEKINLSKYYLEHPEKELSKIMGSFYEKYVVDNFKEGGEAEVFDEAQTRSFYAQEDITLLEQEGAMSIVDTKHGVLNLEYKDGVYFIHDNNGEKLYEGDRDRALEFVKNSYQIDTMKDGGIFALGGAVKDVIVYDKSELIGKNFKEVFPLLKNTSPHKFRIALKSYYSAIDRLKNKEYKRVNEKTSDERVVKHYETALDKIKYLASIRINNTGTITDVTDVSKLAEGGDVNIMVYADAITMKESHFLQDKGYTIDTYSTLNQDAFFEVGNESLRMVQGHKGSASEGNLEIGVAYFVEEVEEPISKKMLRHIMAEFPKSKITLYTNAGVEVHSKEIKKGVFESLGIVKVSLDDIEKLAEGGSIEKYYSVNDYMSGKTLEIKASSYEDAVVISHRINFDDYDNGAKIDTYAEGGEVSDDEIYTKFLNDKIISNQFGEEFIYFWKENKDDWNDSYITQLREAGFSDKDIFVILFGYNAVYKLKGDKDFGINGVLGDNKDYHQRMIDRIIEHKKSGYYQAGFKNISTILPLIQELFTKYNINTKPVVFDSESDIGNARLYFYVGDGIYIGKVLHSGDIAPINLLQGVNGYYLGIVTDSPEKLYDAVNILFNDEEADITDMNFFFNGLGGIDVNDVLAAALGSKKSSLENIIMPLELAKEAKEDANKIVEAEQVATSAITEEKIDEIYKEAVEQFPTTLEQLVDGSVKQDATPELAVITPEAVIPVIENIEEIVNPEMVSKTNTLRVLINQFTKSKDAEIKEKLWDKIQLIKNQIKNMELQELRDGGSILTKSDMLKKLYSLNKHRGTSPAIEQKYKNINLALRAKTGKSYEDVLLGGKADGMDESDIAKKHGVTVAHIMKQVEKGIAAEREHIDNPIIQREIALDHLVEIPDYYDRLEKMEKQSKIKHTINTKKSLSNAQITSIKNYLKHKGFNDADFEIYNNGTILFYTDVDSIIYKEVNMYIRNSII